MNRDTLFVATLFASLVATAVLSTTPARAGQIFVTTDNSVGVLGEYDSTTGAAINASLATDTTGAIAVSGSNLFVAQHTAGDSVRSIGEYDATTGATINASFVSVLSDPEAITASGGELFVANFTNSFEIDKYDATTGATINGAIVTGLVSVDGIAVSGEDLFIASDYSGTIGEIAEYDATTGARLNANLIPGNLGPISGIVVSGGDLFVLHDRDANDDPNSGTIGEYTTSGAAINAALVSGLSDPSGIAASGGDLFVANTVVGEYDATTGATINAALVSGLSNLEGIAVVTPEPSTWVMFVIGAAALLACGLRRPRSVVAR